MPHGVVGVVVLGDSPDVLSHCAVRARNARVPVVACPRCVSAVGVPRVAVCFVGGRVMCFRLLFYF